MGTTPRRIGILGGSFDPVHCGHLAVARLALDHLGLERVWFIPASTPPHKFGTVDASSRHRLAMLRCALHGERCMAVWDGEIRRGGVSYTVDTLGALRTENPSTRFHFIIGSDNLREIATWRRYRALLSMVTLCVVHRPGHSLRLPRELTGATVLRVPSPHWGVSSTMIRGYLARGLSCRYLLPEPVLDYIAEHALYTTGGQVL